MFAVIGGRATDSSSLPVGVFVDGGAAVRRSGRDGISRATAETLDAFLTTLRQELSPFADLARGAQVRFVEPHVVIEVLYTEVTAAGTLRQPIFGAVRPNIVADTVVADGELSTVLSERTGPVKIRANQQL